MYPDMEPAMKIFLISSQSHEGHLYNFKKKLSRQVVGFVFVQVLPGATHQLHRRDLIFCGLLAGDGCFVDNVGACCHGARNVHLEH